MATINPNQEYDIIHTLTFSEASGDCRIRLYRGSTSAISGPVYYRAGTSGDWTYLYVSGLSTTFPVTSTTMQIAHNWNKSGNDYMTPSFRGATNITGITISQKSSLTGTMGNSFMYSYAYGCSSLTSLAVPDISGLTSVGTAFMRSYAEGCSSLTSLAVPDTSSLESVGSNFMDSYARGCSSLTSLAVPDISGLTSVESYFMASYAYSCSSLTSLAVPDTSGLTSVGNYFMAYYARGCTSLTSLDIPDTSGLTSVGTDFMYRYAYDCSSLTKLVLSAVGWFEDNNVDWSVPAGRLGVLEGHVLNSDDLSSWQALTVSGKTLYTNYIRDPDLVYYGGTEPAVTTLPATSVGHDSATLNGSLVSLGFEPSVDVYFEFRKTGASTWSSTTAQAKTTRGTFSANISGLDAKTEYEFRAVVAWDSGAETAYGGVAYFETEAGPEYCEYAADLVRTIMQSQSYNADTERITLKDYSYSADTRRKIVQGHVFTGDTKRATIKRYTFTADTLRKLKGTVWIPLGTFWSLDWDSPDDTLEATVTARDRMELLRKSTFQTSQVLQNKSLYELAEIVLQDAGLMPNEYIIDPALQNIVVPYSWFNPVSHREALRRIAEAGLAAAFQNRDGKIQIERFLIAGDEPVLEITEDDYFPPLRAPSRQDQVANEIIVDTQPLRPASAAEEVYRSNEPITIPGNTTKTITAFYNQPPVIDAVASLDSPPAGVSITEATYYGWGASVKIQNTNATDKQVTLVIWGKPLTVQNKERAIARDEASITENGVLRYEFPANPLVQTLAQAQAIADTLLASVKDPRRDIEVEWRGNPALELGDRVTVKNQDYHVIRQEIEWAGALSARLTGRKVGS